MQPARRNTAAARSTTRDKITNGRLLMNVDLRSSSSRRFRHLVDSYSHELGAELSEAETSLVRQPVALQLQAERMQEAIVRGEPVDADQLIRVSSTSKRLLGIIASRTGKRKPAAGPTLQEYLAKRVQAAADAPEPAESS